MSPALSPPAPLLAPPALGAENYTITAEVAFGAMGSIAAATDAKLQRTVAIKLVLLDADVDAVLRERFLREAEILASLEHPNIVPIHDIVWDNGLPLFYTMKLVNGLSLQAILTRLSKGQAETLRDYSLDRLLTIFRKICDAVAYAHSRRVLHRDLKPANIMVGAFGEVLVMDWGLAKRRNDECRMTNDEPEADSDHSSFVIPHSSFTLKGAVLGTPAYMAPEQAQGRSADLDERADIYALGGVLHAILTLQTPGETASAALLPHIHGGRVPSALLSVVTQARQPEPAQRYASVLALEQDIEAYQAGYATRAEQANPLRLLWLLLTRHRTLSAALAAILLLSAAYVGTVITSEHRATAQAERIRQALALSQTALAENAYQLRDKPAMSQALQSVPADLRDANWRYLDHEASTTLATMALPPNVSATALAAHPTLPSVFAAALSSGRITSYHARTGRELASFSLSPTQGQPSNRVASLAYSPDGGRIIVGTSSPSSVVIYDASTGAALRQWPTTSLLSVAFSPDGQQTLELTDDVKIDEGDISRYNSGIVTLRNSQTFESRWTATAKAAVFTPESDVLAISDTGIQRLAAADGHVLNWFGRGVATVVSIALDPNASTVYFAGSEGSIWGAYLRVERPYYHLEYPAGAHFPLHLAVTPDGQRLITGVSEGQAQHYIGVWHTGTNSQLKPYLGGAGRIQALAIHPTSGELMVAANELTTWDTFFHRPHWWIEFQQQPLNRYWLRTRITYPCVSFWGDDATLISPHDFNTLQPDGKAPPAALALPPECESNRVRIVSAQGSYAAIAYPTLHTNEGSSTLMLLQRSADSVQLIKSLQVPLRTRSIRFSADGQRSSFLFGQRSIDINDPAGLINFNSPTAQRLPDCAAMPDILHDVAWLSPDRLVGVGSDKEQRHHQLQLWNPDTGALLQTLAYPTAMTALAAAPQGQGFAEAGEDRMIRYRDAKTLAVRYEFRAHGDRITALAYHPTKPLLASTSPDRSIRLWHTLEHRLIEEIPSILELDHLEFSPNGTRLAAHTFNNRVLVWELTPVQ